MAKILKYLLLALLASTLCFWLEASNNNYYVGARAIAMGNSSVTFSNTFSAFHNQAGLGFLDRVSIGASYRNNFLLTQTGIKSLALAAPIRNVGVLGLSVNSFGYAAYGEHKFGLAYSKAFGEVLSMALQLNYLQTQFSEPYGNKGVVMGEFGVLGKVNEKLKVGAHIYNPTRAYLEKSLQDRIPTVLKAGIAYAFSENLLSTVEIEKDLDLRPNVKAGLDYKVSGKLSLRGGVNSFPLKVTFGAGFKFNDLLLDLASEYQQTLGFVPSMSLRYRFNKNNTNTSEK